MNNHEVEHRTEIQEKVNTWLHNNSADYQLLLWDFQEELSTNINFKYNPTQFRCWIWDTIIKDLES